MKHFVKDCYYIHLKSSIYSISQVIVSTIICIQVWNWVDWCDKFVISVSQKPDEWVSRRRNIYLPPSLLNWGAKKAGSEGENEETTSQRQRKKVNSLAPGSVWQQRNHQSAWWSWSHPHGLKWWGETNTMLNCHATVWGEYFHTHTHTNR